MPIPFCVCLVCSDARRIGGKNLRRRSSLMINDDLLVDIGSDIAAASFEYGLSLAGIGVCLQTHPHEDHLDTGFILSRHAEYGTLVSRDLLLVGSGDTLRAVDEMVCQKSEYGSIFDPETQSALRLNPRTIAPFETCTAGDYRVTGYPASHGVDRGYVLYSIEQGRHAVFYGTDTSILSNEAWEHLRRRAPSMTWSFSIIPTGSDLTQDRRIIWRRGMSLPTPIGFANPDCSRIPAWSMRRTCPMKATWNTMNSMNTPGNAGTGSLTTD